MMCFSVLQTVPSRHGTISVDEISNGFRRPVWIFQDEVRESQKILKKWAWHSFNEDSENGDFTVLVCGLNDFG